MSGLEGLAALGLACNIFQVISFGRETLGLVKNVYRGGTLDNSLMDKITVIQGVASNIIDVNVPQSGNQEKKLVDVTKKCTGVARDLQEEIAFLVGQNGQGSLRATLKIAAKANWRKRRLDRMEKSLSDAEQLMQSTLMAWIFKSANMASINIHSLGHELRDFVIKYENGSKRTSQLVASEAFKVREVVVRQSGETEEALRAHVTRTSANLERKFENQIKQGSRKRLLDSLLKSLKYPGMNERANQVEDAHAHTFRWLFADADNLSCPDSNDHQYRAGGSKGMGNQNFRSQGDFSYHSKGYRSKARRPVMVWSSFTDWLQSDHSIYWIMGKPGSGKSTLFKFILSEPRTKMALENWRAGAIIASHYFWRPGVMLQRNIKGMLCSIIYQLLLTLPNTLDYASANINGLSQKDACTDWSVVELRHWCSGLIKYCGKPLCLFIDGLDECGPEDDHRKLLDELDRIRTPGVKIVVSSRNEPVFEKRFRHEPQLRVQDLTAEDLRVYAMDMLPQEIRDETCEDLVEKAEGVFLWLVLAVQSINRGFSNEDSLEELRHRVKSLPKSLNDLYKDMWERLNDDCDIYRESAALYFKLVIAAHDKQLSCLKYGLSTMEMMLASLAQPHYAFAERHPVLGSQLLQECKAFHQKVAVRCAGLLGVYGEPGDFPMGLLKDLGGMDRALTKYRDRNVEFRFIHRSAHDFLVDTDEGQKILRHDGTSSEDINIRIVGAHLRAVELLYLILGDAAQPMFVWKNQQRLEGYLADLSGIEDARGGAARELVSLCYELYRSSRIRGEDHNFYPTRIATFFRAAALYPNLYHYSTSIIEKQLVGGDIRSAVLLSMVSPPPKASKFARWLLSLPEVDVNLKCPLVAVGLPWFVPEDQYWQWVDLEAPGPLDHIKRSPFDVLLRTGLELLDRDPAESSWQRYRFLGLVSDFASRGADFRSTILLAIPLDHLARPRPGRQDVIPRFFQFPALNFSIFSHAVHNDDSVLCVVAVQATTVIQRMLESLAMIENGHNSIDEEDYSPSEDEYSSSDLETAKSFLSQRCQEYNCGANDRVIAFLQPGGNFTDMPYRQVSDQDSTHIMDMALECIFEENYSRNDLKTACREAVTRSPFSSIGFRDYLRDTGCFDELAAYELLLEYQEGIVTPKTTGAFKCWQQLMTPLKRYMEEIVNCSWRVR